VAPGAGAAVPLGTVLDGLLQTVGPLQTGVAVGELSRRWDQVVGDPLRRETAPATLQAGVLTVRASSSGWAMQLRFLAETLARNANAVLGRPAVSQVRVVVDPRLLQDRAAPGPVPPGGPRSESLGRPVGGPEDRPK
jgi:predicted nucleic acid-binding Zn ribbon protein